MFGHIGKRKRQILNKLRGIHNNSSFPRNKFLKDLEVTLKNKLNSILAQEEILWHQKSRCQWLAHGDRNTRYFHKKTIIRRRKNKIIMIKNNNGDWIEDLDSIENHATNYFTNIFCEDSSCKQNVISNSGFENFPPEKMAKLDDPSSISELKEALFSMGGTKALDDDGYPAVFFFKRIRIWLVLVCLTLFAKPLRAISLLMT